MPRGSRPGERRGGRQRGTPNKKTVLRNAAISAAAAGSNLSPLDLLLGLMREPNLPLELRISVAHEALPYVHSKQQDCDRPRAGKYGAGSHGVNAEPHPDSGPRVKTAKVSVAAPQRDDGPEVTPLGFLLGVMRDADTPPHLRIRVAAMVAPYVHAKRVTADPSENPVETTVVVDDPYGFKIEPAVARALRDDKQRLVEFLRSPERYPYRDEAAAEMAELKARIAEIGKTLECPSGYMEMDAREDGQRLNELDSVRRRGAVLTTAEDFEDAHLHARLEAYDRSPEGVGRQRISELKFSMRLTPAEENELADLQARYPDLPLDMTKHPLYRSYLACGKALEEARNSK
jgi:hypothetical protein